SEERSAMFEDAPVNTGPCSGRTRIRRFGRYEGRSSNCTVGRVRTTLAGSATCSTWSMTRAFLMHAWERVSTNAGARSAGMDRVTVARIVARGGVEFFLGQIRDLLKSGKYEPVRVRRVTIPKASGKTPS